MDADLRRVVEALAELSDDELERLIAATLGVPPTAPRLLVWIDGACGGQLNRRRGFDYPLQPPEAAIPPEQDAVSIDAATPIRATFAQQSAGVRAQFKALEVGNLSR